MKHRPWIYIVSAAANIVLIVLLLLCSQSYVLRTQFPLLSPRIFVSHPNDIIINFTALRAQLRAFVGQERDFRSGVYFEYLPSGVSIGVNEKEEFISASLLKVPFIIGTYKLLENGSIRREDVLTLSDKDLDPNFGTLWKRGIGTAITVEEAIRFALTQSDNTATRALDGIMSEDLVRHIYDALDIPVVLDGDQPVVSPKNYSSVLRCLYLSCFLEFASSQEILQMLSQTIFDDGIPAGVPRTVPVAHKVGVFDAPEDDRRIRSDCGIVYAAKRPYILCIITEFQKDREPRVKEYVLSVSRMVYDFVSAQ